MISGVTSIRVALPHQAVQKSIKNRAYIDNKKTFFVIKRLTDILISSFVIFFVLSWLTPIISFLIIIDSRGPVFFIQKRVGKGGKSFLCYKFRSMIMNPEADTVRAIPDDPRITRIGKLLRLYNIDELPQFFNVFFGQMSVVGPRPHMHSDCSDFSSFIPGYKFRNLVKPGITGLAQAKGLHGPASDSEMIERRFQWDAFYVRHASWELDLAIIHATIFRRVGLLFASF